MRGLLFAPLLAVAFSTEAQAQAAAPSRSVQFDIAGVNLGMRLEDAEASLRSRGWTVEREEAFTQFSYRERLERAVAGNPVGREGIGGTAPHYVGATKAGETLRIRVGAVPAGLSVFAVRYQAENFQTPQQAFIGAIRAKYGGETRLLPFNAGVRMIYCIRTEPKFCSSPESTATDTPRLTATYTSGGNFSILSEIGSIVENRVEVQLAADVRKALGRSAPSF